MAVWVALTVFAAWVALGGRECPAPLDLLSQPVAASFRIGSFDDALHLAEARTGLSIACPKELHELLKSAPLGGGLEDSRRPEIPVHTFLDLLFRIHLSLDWKFDPQTEVVTLELPWRKSQSQSPRDLLNALRKPGIKISTGDPSSEKNFDALLSHPLNFSKAWRVRQRACYENPFHATELHLSLWKVISASRKPYIVVFDLHPIWISPGHGSLAYYWFKEDGTLVGADLVNTGHRCKVLDLSVNPDAGNNFQKARSESPNNPTPSEIRLVVRFNFDPPNTVRFHLTDKGLQWIGTTDSEGKPSPMRIGDSLMPPQPAS